MRVDLSTMPPLVSNAGSACSAARWARASSPTSCAARIASSAPWSLTVRAVDRAVGGVRRRRSRGRPAQHPATLVLGTAPGGIAEMCITAKVLQLGVPLVTAFHVTRLVVLLLATPLVFVRARRVVSRAPQARTHR